MADIPLSNIVGGGLATKSIKNAFATAGYTRPTIALDPGATQTLSGAVTAATLKTILDVTSGAGRMSFLAVRTADATARTLRVVVTIDGVSPVAYDFTSASAGTNSTGCCLAGKGQTDGGGYFNHSPDIVWSSSIKIEVASSLTETDKFLIQWMYTEEG